MKSQPQEGPQSQLFTCQTRGQPRQPFVSTGRSPKSQPPGTSDPTPFETTPMDGNVFPRQARDMPHSWGQKLKKQLALCLLWGHLSAAGPDGRQGLGTTGKTKLNLARQLREVQGWAPEKGYRHWAPQTGHKINKTKAKFFFLCCPPLAAGRRRDFLGQRDKGCCVVYCRPFFIFFNFTQRGRGWWWAPKAL